VFNLSSNAWASRFQSPDQNIRSEGWYGTSKKTIVLRRNDIRKVHDYAQENENLRNYLFIRIPLKIGLRTLEISTLKLEHIDFENRTFQVLDSKKKTLFPLPLDMLTLQLIQDLVKDREVGYVFQSRQSWQAHKSEPISRNLIWYHTRQIGERAGVKGFNPRILRHYFACNWHYVENKNIEMLRRILRHKSLAITHTYLSRLVFFEDLQREFDAVRNEPFAPMFAQSKAKPLLSEFYKQWCSKCANEEICRIIEEMSRSPGATGCKYHTPKPMEFLESS